MSRRKQLDDNHKNLGPEDAARRRKQEARAFELGMPLAPDYLWNDRRLYAIWKKNAKRLLDARLLSYADGDALLALCKAELNNHADVMEAVYDATWTNRQSFPDPHPAGTGETLKDFLEAVRQERQSFTKRMLPAATMCLDSNNAEYQWQENDPAAVARRYAQDVVEQKIKTGELVTRAATRFIEDLVAGSERGIYFDPVAARHICVFAERFCGLKLLAWQVFALVNIFAWKKASGYRRFTEAWISCAKKNGKTRLASCVALWGLVCDSEQYPDVFSAATKKEQSRLVWRDARRCVSDNPELCAHVQRWAGALAVKDTDGSFTHLSSDEKSMDGLRPHVIIADEVSFWSDREQWDKLVKGNVSRVQPLTFAVTTAGTTKQCFAHGKFALGEKILRSVFKDDSTFVLIFAIDADDKWDDESCWPKANPSLGVTLQIERLQKTRTEALEDSTGVSSFQQYHCNVWPEVVLSRSGSISAAKWDACSGLDLLGEKDPDKALQRFLEMNREVTCFLGVDIGLTSDMTAIATFWPKARFAKGNETITRPAVSVHFFIPEVGLLDKEKAWNVPLSQWAREGWIDLLPGDMTDVRLVQKEVRDLMSMLYVREVGFDPWQFSVAAAELNESGIACVEVPQLPSQLTPPIQELQAAVNRGELVHFNNPVLAWNAGNVVFAGSERHGGLKPEKLSPPHTKIDGIQATINAWHRALANPIPTPPRIFFFGEDDKVRVSNLQTGRLDDMPPVKGQQQ